MGDHEKNLQELFSYPSGEFRKVGTTEVGDIYTSDELINKFIIAINESSRSKSLTGILHLIKKKKVNVGYLNDNIFKFYAFKFLGDFRNNHLAGFYDLRSKKIFLLMDNNINYIGFANNEALSRLLLHEVLHMSALLNPTEFYHEFRSDLYDYYCNFYDILFTFDRKKISDGKFQKTMNSFINILIKEEVSPGERPLTSKMLMQDLKPFLLSYSTLGETDFASKWNLFINYVYNFMNDSEIISNNKELYNPVFLAFYGAYQRVFGNSSTDSFCGQEIIIPSEIICISSELTTFSKREERYNKVISNI